MCFAPHARAPSATRSLHMTPVYLSCCTCASLARLRRGLVAPLRMRRVDGWGWVIPGVLGQERLPRFVEDQRLLINMRSQLKLLKVRPARTRVAAR